MHSKLHVVAVAMTALALGACVQATRHSNTMLFGTNTQLGIRVGASASSVPEINVGYARQEAVVLPLVANSKDDGKYQSPCDVSQAVEAHGAEFAVHPCLLVGVNGSAQDSYSVLASFGAKFDAGAQPNGAQAKGGLAQYFATGMAAQLLAFNGGASVVATGDAAETASATKPDPKAVSALFGNEENFARGHTYATTYGQFKAQLLDKVDKTKPEELNTKITAFEQTAGAVGSGIAADCTSPAACKKAIVDNDAYRNIYPLKKAEFDRALDAWKTE